MQMVSKKLFSNSTAKAFILSHVLSCPFWGIFNILPILLCKELHASPFQITTVIALKPLSALFSAYWSSAVFGKKEHLVKNLFWACLLKFSPFLLIPFFSNPWFLIICFGLHMCLLRGIIPSWMELLKLHLPPSSRGKVCAAGSTVNYLGNALFPFLFGFLLDHFVVAWKWLFPATSLLAMCSLWFIHRMSSLVSISPLASPSEQKKIKDHLYKPWKTARQIITRRPDFFRFQIGFFLGGAGLMTIHAALPNYFVDILNLSYTKICLAICFCKGIGFAFSSPIWVKVLNRFNIFSFCARVPLFAACFPILLILAQFNLFFVFIAYFCYGVMQGGSELGWKMSGPTFAQEDDSSPYSSINVLAVGIRGGIFPYFGAFLLLYGGLYIVLAIGGLFCLAGSFYLWHAGANYSKAQHAPELLKE